MPVKGDGEVGGAPEATGEQSVAAEQDRLARSLRETRLQLAITQSRLAALEQSRRWNSAALWSARRGGRGHAACSCPWGLVRLWRERGGLTGPGAATLALACRAQLGDLAGGGERFLFRADRAGTRRAGVGGGQLELREVWSSPGC